MKDFPFPIPTDSTPDPQLVERYVAGECTLGERAAMERWARAHPASGRALLIMAQDGAAGGAFPDADESRWTAAAVSRIAERVGIHGEPVTHNRRMVPRMPSSRGTSWRMTRVLSAAAAFATAAALAVVAFRSANDGPQAHVADQIYTTATGQRATVTLPNGSQVTLAPETRLMVRHEGENTTSVTLMGEAVFTVAHSAASPFIVHAGPTTVRVLGTTFSVRRDSGSAMSQVMVADGRVAVYATNTPAEHATILDARMVATIGDSGDVRVTPNVAVDEYLGWTQGQLVFRQAPVSNIVAELERHYGVTIRLADSALARRPLTWTVSVSARSLDGVLDALSIALGAHYTRTRDVITLAPGQAAAKRAVPVTIPRSQETQYGR